MKPIWYGGDDYGSAEATGHGARQSDAAQSGPQVVWTLSGYAGVRGFFEVADFGRASGGRERLLDWLEHDYKIDQQVQRLAADAAAMGESASSVYHQDYRHLPYKLRNGEMQVLSRWNMAQQKLTVSRVQCAVRVAASGAATLTSCGKGPTLWRAWGGPWNALHREERRAPLGTEYSRRSSVAGYPRSSPVGACSPTATSSASIGRSRRRPSSPARWRARRSSRMRGMRGSRGSMRSGERRLGCRRAGLQTLIRRRATHTTTTSTRDCLSGIRRSTGSRYSSIRRRRGALFFLFVQAPNQVADHTD